VYMAPPFLAYYGVITQNQSLISESYNQIKLYRSYLIDSSAHNIWRHITLGTGTDYGHWSTGEANFYV
jgi:rhamnogalacturonyl hydrolase YesR